MIVRHEINAISDESQHTLQMHYAFKEVGNKLNV